MNAAREKVRVAHSLKNLATISAAFKRGELSYSKVRAMTRIADVDNEDYLMKIAHYGTAYHVETLVQKYRRAKRVQDCEVTNQQHRDRYLDHYYDADGCLVIKGRLPAEQGALIVKALEKALDDQFQDQFQAVPDVTAETSDTLDAHIDDGPHVTAETSRRLACDCSQLNVVENAKGEPLSIGRETRSIPPAIRRALRLRDNGCRFPGCTHTRFVDGHHIQHWADGGETSLDNLVQLCRHHHRLVHEGGYDCQRMTSGEIIFTAPDEQPLPIFHSMNPIDEEPYAWFEKELRGLDIDPLTCVPEWYAGDTIDWNLAVAALFPNPPL